GGKGKIANGGGGGNKQNYGGGGGGGFTDGGVGGNDLTPWCSIGSDLAVGGLSLGTYIAAQNRLFLGGGGGSGDYNNGVGSNGANGGGLVIVQAATLNGNGKSIRANGADETIVGGMGFDADGVGGGGGGGLVYVDVPVYMSPVNLEANGGHGGDNQPIGNEAGTGGGGGSGSVLTAQGAFPGFITVNINPGRAGILTAPGFPDDGTTYNATPGGTNIIGPITGLALVTDTPGSCPIGGIINSYTGVTNIQPGCRTILTVADATNFHVGDKVLIIQMKGADIDLSNTSTFGNITALNSAGANEFSRVASISGSQITLIGSLTNTYSVTGLVQLIMVPEYTNATVTSTILAQPWNGTTGGVISFFVSNTLTMLADVDASGVGFRGGNISKNPDGSCGSGSHDYFYDVNQPGTSWLTGGAEKGEGIAIISSTLDAGKGKLANGGGGGNKHNYGGAGGSNYTAGGLGGNDLSSYCAKGTDLAIGGLSLASFVPSQRLFLGGGGGCGDYNNGVGSDGANGGGIVIVHAANLVGNSNTIRANGADETVVGTGVDAFGIGSDGVGGGGGGGLVYLDVPSYTGAVSVEANGGHGGDNVPIGWEAGTGGGGGTGAALTAQAGFPGSVTLTTNPGRAGILTAPGNDQFGNPRLDDGTTYDATPGDPNMSPPVTSLSLIEDTTAICPCNDTAKMTIISSKGATNDTFCFGDTIYLHWSGGPWGRFIVDDTDVGGIFPIPLGGERVDTAYLNGDGTIGRHHVCLVVYSENPDSVAAGTYCTDTVCLDPVVLNCNSTCQSLQGQAVLVKNHIGDAEYEFYNNGSIEPAFVNWLVDGTQVSQTTGYGHFDYTFTTGGEHVVCMQAAFILTDSLGNNICCYQVACDSTNIDSCDFWRSSDAVTYAISPTDFHTVTFTYTGSTNHLTLVWNFGDGSSDVNGGEPITHRFNTGTYTVCTYEIWSMGDTTVIPDSAGVCCCVDTICLKVTIDPCVVTDFNISLIAQDPTAAVFEVTPTPATGVIVSSVDFTLDGTPVQSGPSEFYTYVTPSGGNHVLCATINYTISFEDGEKAGCITTVCDTFNLDSTQAVLGLLKFYPNPTRDNLTVVINASNNDKFARVELQDNMGRALRTSKFENLTQGIQQMYVSLSDLAPGLYAMKVTVGENTKTVKVVKE
ncbi:MAG: hypothetical protein JWO06_665, partial [Bacteroidota bacterium]|nr:hypothetical protein [Bacteroidota bacterium]